MPMLCCSNDKTDLVPDQARFAALTLRYRGKEATRRLAPLRRRILIREFPTLRSQGD
jgi:hypothetical protein